MQTTRDEARWQSSPLAPGRSRVRLRRLHESSLRSVNGKHAPFVRPRCGFDSCRRLSPRQARGVIGSTASSNLARPGSNPGGLAPTTHRGPERIGYLLEEGPVGPAVRNRNTDPHTTTATHLRLAGRRRTVIGRAPGSAGRRRVRAAPGGPSPSVAQVPTRGRSRLAPTRPQALPTTHQKGGAHVVPEAGTARDACRSGLPFRASPELGRRPRVGCRLLDAAAPFPRPRLGGRLVLRVRVDADA